MNNDAAPESDDRLRAAISTARAQGPDDAGGDVAVPSDDGPDARAAALIEDGRIDELDFATVGRVARAAGLSLDDLAKHGAARKARREQAEREAREADAREKAQATRSAPREDAQTPRDDRARDERKRNDENDESDDDHADATVTALQERVEQLERRLAALQLRPDALHDEHMHEVGDPKLRSQPGIGRVYSDDRASDHPSTETRLAKLEAALGDEGGARLGDPGAEAEEFRRLSVRDALELLFDRIGPDFLRVNLPLEEATPLADQIQRIRQALAKVQQQRDDDGGRDAGAPQQRQTQTQRQQPQQQRDPQPQQQQSQQQYQQRPEQTRPEQTRPEQTRPQQPPQQTQTQPQQQQTQPQQPQKQTPQPQQQQPQPQQPQPQHPQSQPQQQQSQQRQPQQPQPPQQRQTQPQRQAQPPQQSQSQQQQSPQSQRSQPRQVQPGGEAGEDDAERRMRELLRMQRGGAEAPQTTTPRDERDGNRQEDGA